MRSASSTNSSGCLHSGGGHKAETHPLLAASLGLSRMYSDDLAQLEAGMALYDAFYRWSRDATGETHNWPVGHVATKPARQKAS